MNLVKIVVSVPVEGADRVREAMASAGAGKMGSYAECSFSYRGRGRFRPLPGAHPKIGSIGKLEEVEEERIEMICPRKKAKEVISAMKKVHPYEEPAFDLMGLLDEEDL